VPARDRGDPRLPGFGAADGTPPILRPVPNAFSCHGLTKRYGPAVALDAVDLDVEEGELVGLLGPNGAGKSTLVKIACGLVRPTGGRAEVCGEPAGSAAARAAIGYLAELFRFPD
jgi:ABC-2 type transport system ATP-binding protein